MASSEDIRNLITRYEQKVSDYYQIYSEYEMIRSPVAQEIKRKIEGLNTIGPQLTSFRNTVSKLKNDLEIQLQTESENKLHEIKIESNLDIPPSMLTPLGESIEPITTQIKTPGNQGLILLAGLVAAAVILK